MKTNIKLIKFIIKEINIFVVVQQIQIQLTQYFLQEMLTFCLSSYALTSTILFLFPTILHRKQTLTNKALAQSVSSTKSKMLRISHRGSPRYATENTIEAFRKVYNVSDCLEMDVCETADGVLVVHHDRNLKDSCGVDKDVNELKYENLPKYQDKIRLDFGVDRWMTTNNEKLPKLQSVFQMFQGIPMDIQLKTPTPTAIKSFIKLIHKYDREDHTIIGIRGPQNYQLDDYYKKLAKKQPAQDRQILTFMNDRSVYLLYLSYVIGLLPFIPIRDNSLQIPVYSQEFQQWAIQRGKRNGQSELKIKIGCQLIRAMNFLSKPLIWHLKKRGIMTFGWVCNTKQSMERAQWMGVAGIMSDEPYELDRFVSEHNAKNQ